MVPCDAAPTTEVKKFWASPVGEVSPVSTICSGDKQRRRSLDGRTQGMAFLDLGLRRLSTS